VELSETERARISSGENKPMKIVDYLAEELKRDGEWQRMVKRQERKEKRARMAKLLTSLRAKAATAGR
jgi:hypothetical protein